MSEVAGNINTSENYDAQQMVEEVKEGDRKVPEANVDADYEASKQFSVSTIDRTEEGAAAAEAATSPDLKVPSVEKSTLPAATTGSPDDYKEMATDANPNAQAGRNVSDDVVQKALEKGNAGK
ncbi:MAG: hypothetical protein KME27_19920 [Lyngbya sp. HA4199-MV5]|jgi:hypothetical protein|nr:hypothetical protein [Lyngbya sp. HA4199-MV5]